MGLALCAAGAAASGSLPAQEACGTHTDQRLAAQAVALAREAVTVEMPAELPDYLIRYFPGGQEDYAASAGTPGEAFLDPVMARRVAPKLYGRLKRHYRSSWKALARSIPCIVPLYRGEADVRVKDLLARYVEDVVYEAHVPYTDLHFLVAPLVELASMDRDAMRHAKFWESLKLLGPRNLRETDIPLILSAVDGSRSDESGWSDAFYVLGFLLRHLRDTGAARASTEQVVSAVFNLVTADGCPLHARIYFARDQEDYAHERPDFTETLLFQWLKESLSRGGDDLAETIIREYAGRDEVAHRLFPEMVRALDSAHSETVSASLTFIDHVSGRQKRDKSSLPYEEIYATEVTKPGGQDTLTLKCEAERAKAIAFWKHWWQEHRAEFEGSAGGNSRGDH